MWASRLAWTSSGPPLSLSPSCCRRRLSVLQNKWYQNTFFFSPQYACIARSNCVSCYCLLEQQTDSIFDWKSRNSPSLAHKSFNATLNCIAFQTGNIGSDGFVIFRCFSSVALYTHCLRKYLLQIWFCCLQRMSTNIPNAPHQCIMYREQIKKFCPTKLRKFWTNIIKRKSINVRFALKHRDKNELHFSSFLYFSCL